MKTRYFLLGAIGLLAIMASCSNDELVSVNRDGDEIAFNVVTNATTRAADVYCNNNLPSKFKVWAQLADGTNYINGDVIEKRGGNSERLNLGGGTSSTIGWINTSGTRYWPDPEKGALNFFANVNGGDLSISNGVATISDYEIKDNVSTQEDILYAAALNKTKPEGQFGTVDLNFRHALSQIVFKAKNTNKNLYVVIDGVKVCHLSNSGSFTFSKTTDVNYENHTNNTEVAYNCETGSWNSLEGDASYGVTFDKVTLVGSTTADAQSLTFTNPEGQEFNKNSMLLMPQEKAGWGMTIKDTDMAEEMMRAADDAAGLAPTSPTGTFYFAVKCAIYNVAGESFNEGTDIPLWGTTGETKYVVIPANINWEPGRKYIYTFVFGEGNGGYQPDPDNPGPNPGPNPDPDPDPDPDPENPTPVLVPITFNVTVDDFAPVEGTFNADTQGVLQLLQ